MFSGMRRHPKPQRQVIHTVYNDSRVLGSIFCYPRHPALQHVVAIDKVQLRALFNPHLILRMLRKIIKGSDVKLELPGLAELSHAGAQRNDRIPGNATACL